VKKVKKSYVDSDGKYCDDYGCYPAPPATTKSGGYTAPYCASNGYCNNTMTYYNEKGQYCDIAYCYTYHADLKEPNGVPNINDACDRFGCYNHTQKDDPKTATEDTTTGATTITITTTDPPTITEHNGMAQLGKLVQLASRKF
jgi:hypothetical protein